MLNPYVCICNSNTKELTLVDILGVLSNKFLLFQVPVMLVHQH